MWSQGAEHSRHSSSWPEIQIISLLAGMRFNRDILGIDDSMAEAIGIAAAIVGLITAAAKSVKS